MVVGFGLAGAPEVRAIERDHVCKFSLCVNFDHVEVVTKEINGERRWEGKRKINCLVAEEEVT
jgi:hypothetical protein